jgi:chemotaxis family two-component system response regulator PixG
MKAINDQSKKIKSQLQNAVDLKQTCKIYVTTAANYSWSFYFKKGCLIWASSSDHRFRRLYRITSKICPEIDCFDTKLREQEISELWEYLLIGVLYKRKLISNIHAEEIIREIVKEVLFDCLLARSKITQVKAIFEIKSNPMGAILRSSLFQQPIAKIDYQNIQGIESRVMDWQAVDGIDYSPNYAPVIKNIERLKTQVESAADRQLFISIDGKKTLRELAIAMQQEPIAIARYLAPHLKNKAVVMQQVEDLQLANLYFTSTSSYTLAENGQPREYIQELDLPLIIYVDNDPHICQQVAQILNPVGYRIIPVSDAAQTLIVLLENTPDLIFLNAIMSDANGYKLCAQIRKMSTLKNIPVIIVRDRERKTDFIRAKIAKATDSIGKPIQPEKLLTIAQKYTQNAVYY